MLSKKKTPAAQELSQYALVGNANLLVPSPNELAKFSWLTLHSCIDKYTLSEYLHITPPPPSGVGGNVFGWTKSLIFFSFFFLISIMPQLLEVLSLLAFICCNHNMSSSPINFFLWRIRQFGQGYYFLKVFALIVKF